MDFFTRFTSEKTPQNNFSCQNFSVQNNYFFQWISMDSKRLLNLKMYLSITCVPFAMIYFINLKGANPVIIYFVIHASDDWVVPGSENVQCVEKKLKNVFQVLNCLKNYLKNTPVNMKKDFTWNKNLKLTGTIYEIQYKNIFIKINYRKTCHSNIRNFMKNL